MLSLPLGCSERVGDELLDIEAIKRDACEQSCETLDACNVDLSWSYEMWPEPEGCVERCMVLKPLLHEENQCGSRQILALRCIGDLDCDGYAAYEAGQPTPTSSPDFSAPCVTEWLAGCSVHEPFDLDETIPTPTWP